MRHKRCSTCKVTKLETEFYKRSEYDGIQALCKSCVKAAKARYRSDPVKYQRELAGRRAHRRKHKTIYPVLDRKRNLSRFGITPVAMAELECSITTWIYWNKHRSIFYLPRHPSNNTSQLPT